MSVIEELAAAGPWAAHEKALDLYGRLIGTWDVVNRYLDPGTGEWRHGTVVWTFGWTLAGHTVQDVMWFTAPAADGYPARITGSTVRHYDQTRDVWHIVWFSPAGRIVRLLGRAGEGGDIDQEGTQDDGRLVRWRFTDLTDSTFRWLGHLSDDNGATWQLEQEMTARRRL